MHPGDQDVAHEVISWGGEPLVYIIHPNPLPERTVFVTPPEFKQQLGFIVYPAGGEIAKHIHAALERHLVGTSEVLVMLRGSCLIDIYNNQKRLVATRELKNPDVILMVGGGHGFRMKEDTVFLEIKQGPYLTAEEKERF
ncbi:MAG: hypothetical protein JXA73_17130 [Acidobacteria bacterium]|nr:hypothetical protein [Acidobacteriota bacterium]